MISMGRAQIAGAEATIKELQNRIELCKKKKKEFIAYKEQLKKSCITQAEYDLLLKQKQIKLQR